MKYKDALILSYQKLSEDPLTRFIGYNLKYGSKHYGILNGINPNQIIEMPVAENLMVGLAIGMSLEGFKPVVIFERQDFILNAMDALINHLDKISKLSDNLFNPKVIIKATVGCNKPFNSGIQHTQNYTNELFSMLKNIKVINLNIPDNILLEYEKASKSKNSVVLVDYRELYDSN